MIIQRRTLLIGLASMFAAPAVVKAEWIMPVKKIVEPPFRFYSSLFQREMTIEDFSQIVDERLDISLFVDVTSKTPFAEIQRMARRS